MGTQSVGQPVVKEMEPFEKEQQVYHRSTLDEPIILSGPFWAELRTFLAVAKAKSFNKAGDILGISHPTVSRQVKRLQDLMGVPLICQPHKELYLRSTVRTSLIPLMILIIDSF